MQILPKDFSDRIKFYYVVAKDMYGFIFFFSVAVFFFQNSAGNFFLIFIIIFLCWF